MSRDGRGATDGVDTVFVGRTAEMAAVAAAGADAAAGSPRVVLVEGVAGVGKTTFLRRALALVAPDDNIICLRADETTRDTPMGLVGRITGAASSPFAAGLALLDVLAERQRTGPVVLVVEDLHWADVASSRSLLVALRRLDHDRVLVLLTIREEEINAYPPWERLLADEERCRRVRLGPFSAADCAAVARAHGVPLGSRSAERLWRHTAGHPLYVRTLLLELPAEELNGPDNLRVPRSLSATTLGLVASLPPPARALAEALAVAGGTSDLVTLGQVAGIEDPTTALEPLLAAGLVEWMPHEVTKPVQFAHPLYRTAVYDDLSRSRRQALHQAASAIVDPTTALGHRVAAAGGPDRDLARDLEEAAADALRARRSAAAAHYLLSAAEMSETPDDCQSNLLRGARLLLDAGDVRAAQQLELAIVAIPPGPMRSLVLGLLYLHTGRTSSAEIELAEAASYSRDAPTVAAEALVQLATLHTSLTRAADAIMAIDEAFRLGVLHGPPAHNAAVLLAIGTSQRDGVAAGLAILDQRCSPAELETDETRALVAGTRGMFEQYAGMATAATTHLRRALAFGQGTALGVHLPRVHVLLARTLTALGEWDDALVHARAALSLATDEGQTLLIGQAHAAAATIQAPRGAWADAAERLEAARDAAEASRSPESELWTRMAEAELARAQGRPAHVVETLLPLHGGPVDRGLPAFALTWWPPLIEALVRLDDLDEAAKLLDQLEAAADDPDRRARQLAGHRARLLAASGDWRGASTLFEQSLGAPDRRDRALETALTHHAFGCHLIAGDRRREGLEQLGVSRRLLLGLGADAYVALVDADLGALGAPADAPSAVDVFAALTNRECEVVTLVVKGCSNREAAAALYVSVKSIEYHLAKAYRKLGARSRSQLRALVVASRS